MSKKNIALSALAAVFVLSMAAFAVAGQGHGRGFGGCGGPGNGPNGLYTQLSPEKQAAVDSIYDKYSPQFTELRNQMWTKRATLQAMVNGGNADEAKIGQLTTDISNLRQKMWDMRDAMSNDLTKETGIIAGNGFGSCPGYGQTSCPGNGSGHGFGDGPGYGRGNMRGQGHFGRGMY